MRLALGLAARSRGRTRPNPMVGAVLVRDGRVVGMGFHRRAGAPHAEVLALRAAGVLAYGATVYVTLEPCCHVGRTPPCTRAMVASGVRRVVVAMRDPNPQVAGRGIRELRNAGIATRLNVLREPAEALNEVYLTWRRLGRPFVTVKVAQSLDGKIATRMGHSRWMSGAASRRYVQFLRGTVDAVAVGVQTVLADDPRLGVRRRQVARKPWKVIFDSRLRTPPWARVFQGGGPVLMATTEKAPVHRRKALEAKGACLVVAPLREGRVDARFLLGELARREITHLLVEGGGELIAALVKARAVDRWISIIAPCLVGGRHAPTPMGGIGIASLRQAPPFRITGLRRLGADLWVEARPRAR